MISDKSLFHCKNQCEYLLRTLFIFVVVWNLMCSSCTCAFRNSNSNRNRNRIRNRICSLPLAHYLQCKSIFSNVVFLQHKHQHNSIAFSSKQLTYSSSTECRSHEDIANHIPQQTTIIKTFVQLSQFEFQFHCSMTNVKNQCVYEKE